MKAGSAGSNPDGVALEEKKIPSQPFQILLCDIGEAVFTLNTAVVGLDAVENGHKKPATLNISWEPKDRKIAARKSRKFILESVMVRVSEVINQFVSALSKLPKFKDEKKEGGNDTSMAEKVAMIATKVLEKDDYLIPGVVLLVHWRNRIVHPNSGAELKPQQRKILLRVRPETLCRITEFSEHESNGRELDEGERVAVEVLPVLGQSAAAVEPGDGAFDHPTPGLDDEALHPIGSLDDLGLEIGQDAGQGAVKDRPLIGAVGEQFPEKGKQTEQGRQQRETAVAILNVGGGDDAVQQQALRIDQNMPLLALDQLAGIEAVAVDASPPFSALFTL